MLMRKTGKFFAVALAAACALCTLTGCIEDYVPESYGAWDGNYLYAGNVKSKTTGEDPETLVSSVVIGDTAYSVSQCVDYEIVGNRIYSVLNLTYDSDCMTCLIEYDVETNLFQTLYVETEKTVEETTISYDVYRIVKLLDEYKILQTENGNWFAVDRSGEIVEKDCNELQSYEQAGDYLYQWEKGVLTYRTWLDETWVTAADFTGTAVFDASIEYVQKGERGGLLIQTYDERHLWEGLHFYDFGKAALTSFDTSAFGENMQKVENAPKNEYFITYDFEWVDYSVRENLFSIRSASTTHQKNCVLWRLVYAADGIELEKAYVFDKDKNYLDIRAIYGDKIYVNAEWYALATGCSGGGRQTAYYRIRMQYDEEMRFGDSVFSVGVNQAKEDLAKDEGVTCGEYTYYIRTNLLYSWYGRPYVCLLNRFDGTQMETMQFWASYSYEKENYCEEMWRQISASEVEDEVPISYTFIVRES